MERIRTAEELKLDRVIRRVKQLKRFYKHLGIYVIVNAILLGINYFDMEPGETFWHFSTFSTLFFWGIGLVIHAVRVFGRDVFLGADWEERKMAEFMNQNPKSKWE